METNQLAIKKDCSTEVWNTLKNSIYPGAQDNSVVMVLEYCKSMKLDPILKPVHIVPMNGKDVVMPGVALYRILAARSGNYAGMSEPEYGADIEETFIDKYKNKHTVKYPEWCKITVKKLLNGTIIEFVAKEYWRENYATMGRDNTCPNSMWEKRPYGQLAKCAEAQALRKAFPELLGGMVTSEEMEGKGFENAKTVSPAAPVHEYAEPRKPVYIIDKTPLDAQYLHDLIMEKIDDVSSDEDLETYESWKNENKQQLSKFATDNKDLAMGYAEAINAKRETIAGAVAE